MSETIIQSNIVDQYKKDMVDYAIETNRRRSIPEYKDGLKLVHRRILATMAFDETKSMRNLVKSAKIVGSTMGKLHCHGDCLHYDTLVYSTDGNAYKIGDLYANNVQKLEILAIDANTMKPIATVAHSFRIGQYTNKIYNVQLSNGYVIRTTANHPFMLADGHYMKAEDLINGMRLKSCVYTIYSGRPSINSKLIQNIVYESYYGPLEKGFEKHHIDHNPLNNTISNLQKLSIEEHRKAHLDTGIIGLDNGRKSMSTPGTIAYETNRRKNSLLMKLYTKDQSFRKFKYYINQLEENGTEITVENYESLRGTVYNLPIIDNLLKKYNLNSFEDLLNYELPSISELYEQNKVQMQDAITMEFAAREYDNFISYTIFKRFDILYDAGCLNYETYISNGSNLSLEDYNFYLQKYLLERPIVASVTVEELKEPIPMFDFTVNIYENMLIPAGNINDTRIPFICVHNSSIYDAIKPMSNIFEIQIPLIDNHGNFGSPQGDGAAAMRYTEIKLSKFTLDYVIDEVYRCKEIVNWLPNFDYTEQEPEYLPVKIPLLLINGSYGLGVGLMTEIPKHNINEVIDETIKLMHDTSYEPVLIPDNCMHCEIVNADFKEMGLLGRGKFRVRGIIDIETYQDRPYKGYTCLHIKSTPDRVWMLNIKDKIDDLIDKGRLPQVIRYYEKKSPNKLDISFILILKKGSDPQYVKEMLYKHTQLETTQTINFEVMDGVNPMRSNYKDYLLSFIQFRMLIKIRYYSHLYKDAITDAHEKESYINILENKEIDIALNYLRKQDTIDDKRDIEYLVNKFNITDLQAKFILNAGNKTQSKGYLNKYKEDVAKLHAIADSCQEKIMNENLLLKEIEDELLQCKKEYGHPRRCRVIDVKDENNIPAGTFKVVITNNNFIRKVLENDTVKCTRGGSNSNPKLVTTIDNRDNLILFDNSGRVFKYPVYKIALCDKTSIGTDIRIIMKKLTADIIRIIPESVLVNITKKKIKHFITVISSGNRIKKLDIEDILACNTSGIVYAKLPDNDIVKDVEIIPQNLDVVIYSGHKALRIDNNEVPHLKRNTMGNLAMNTNENIEGISIIYPNTTYIVTITKNGKINKIDVTALQKSSRNLAGSSIIKLTKGDSIFAMYGVDNNSILSIKTSDGPVDIKVEDIPVSSSVSTGKKLVSGTLLKCIVYKK